MAVEFLNTWTWMQVTRLYSFVISFTFFASICRFDFNLSFWSSWTTTTTLATIRPFIPLRPYTTDYIKIISLLGGQWHTFHSYFFSLVRVMVILKAPGHGKSLHFSILTESPTQSFPPYKAGCWIIRSAILLPQSHVFEQELQFPNVDHVQSTNVEKLLVFQFFHYIQLQI